MAWDDFASPTGGFDRTGDALSKSLLFAPPVQQQVETWPDEREELRKKLKKAHRETAKFDWNTTPQVVVQGVNNEVMVIEESFVDFWADVLLSAGWTDYDELTYRETNWVLVGGADAAETQRLMSPLTARLQGPSFRYRASPLVGG